MKQEDDIQKEVTLRDDSSFLSRVTDFFSKLMDKFTNGKYSTPEEKSFFGDENNLYDEDGNLTPEYQKRIKDYEDLIKSKNVDEFLHEVHSEDSEEFGPAYNDNELAILSNSNDFISEKEIIERDLDKSKKESADNDEPFDLDAWLDDYVLKNNLCENGDKAREIIKDMILDELEAVKKEMEEYEVNQIVQGFNVREIVKRAMDETIKEREA